MSLFITFEGVEGSGKTTQVALLCRRLEAEGYSVLRVHEPGSTPLGNYLRRWLKEGQGTLDPTAELLLFAAARAQLVQGLLRPALAEGRVVVCDRYADSSVAYQAYGRGVPLDQVQRVNEVATGGLRPTVTFLLDCPPEVGLGRRRSATPGPGQGDRFEDLPLDFHRRVRQGYLEMARQDPRRWHVLDATQEADQVARYVWDRVRPLLPESRR